MLRVGVVARCRGARAGAAHGGPSTPASAAAGCTSSDASAFIIYAVVVLMSLKIAEGERLAYPLPHGQNAPGCARCVAPDCELDGGARLGTRSHLHGRLDLAASRRARDVAQRQQCPN